MNQTTVSESDNAEQPGAQPRVAGTPPDAELWADFARATTMNGFCRSWLALQCTQLEGVRAGMVLVGAPDRGPFRPLVFWPDGRRNLSYLTHTAQEALTQRRGVVATPDPLMASEVGAHCEVAYPLEVRNELYGAIVLDVYPQAESELQALLRQLHWGAGWLESLFSRERLEQEVAAKGRIQRALDLVVTALGHDRLHAACMSFTTALATACRCDRVSLGFLTRGRAVVKAVSHSAEFKKQANLLRSIEAAMDEAIDQRLAIRYPSAVASSTVVRAHAALSHQYDSVAMCTVPMMGSRAPIGAIVLERPSDQPFDDDTFQLCQSVAAVVGPILEVQQRDDRWLPAKMWDAGRTYVRSLIGPQHVALKLATVSVIGLVLFCFFAKGEYRVSAKTILEPVVQRAAVAPFNGFIREAPVRAGAVVQAGQVLCLLDDRDLKLERVKSAGRAEELRKEYSKAMAEQKASQVEIVSAQLRQVEAEIALYDDQLARTRVVAPFNGIVVTGDLSQELGAPVDKGKVLFEIAPLDAYRLIVEVDERDIVDVHADQTGTLLLSAFPTEAIPFTVETVTPVSTAKDGRNFFRVESRFEASHERLLPGMEGAGKISVDQRRLVWIWTHQITDWIRLAVWSWLP